MLKMSSATALFIALSLLSGMPSYADTLGPAQSYSELRMLAESARNGDVLLVTGEFSAEGEEPLGSSVLLHITSDRGKRAVVRHLSLSDISVSFSDIDLVDTLTIEGVSNVELLDGVTLIGAEGESGLVFNGSGTLLVDPGCQITGGAGAAGVTIAHQGGNFYASFEGDVRGGDGTVGGTGMIVSPLQRDGTMMIEGNVRGGDGSAIGGSGLNLYNLSGNAFVTVAGNMRGGRGPAGGDGMQIVSMEDNVSVGISGRIYGGRGTNYGGDALMLMNAVGASSVNLTGAFAGGDATAQTGQPGQSLLIVGDSDNSHVRVGDCLLQDGENTFEYNRAEPDVTPLPEITSSVDDVTPLETPTPEPVPTGDPTSEPTEGPADTEAPESTQSEAERGE